MNFRTLLALALCLPSMAHSYDMTRRDRMSILYSNQVVFDRRGEPLVSVRLTESQKEIRFTTRGGAVLMPSGDSGSQVRSPARTEWTVRLESSQAGETRWWLAAERFPAHQMTAIAERRAHWVNQGHDVKLFEAGALIGLAGQTLDTRTITIGISPQKTRLAALRKAYELADQLTLKDQVLSEPLKRPSGWLVAREKRSGIEIRSKDLIWLTPDEGQTTKIIGMEWGHGTPKRGRMDRTYAGDLYFTVGQDGLLAAANVLSAEQLLEGVVPSELYTSAPMEALKAQSVTARGQLLTKVGTRHRSDPYLLCAETHCQVYSGTTKRHPRTSKAVNETRGLLLFHGDDLVDTTYSSTCGGHSEAFHKMWGGTPLPYSMGQLDNDTTDPTPIAEDALAQFLARPPASFCSKRKGLFRWTVKRSGREVTEAVNRIAPIGEIHTITALERGHSGRALRVKYSGTKGSHVVDGSYNNRKLLGGLRSGMWLVERRGGQKGKAPKTWRFRGGGFGHGVGMCQHGAMEMAQRKRNFDVILRHYYRGSTLKKAW